MNDERCTTHGIMRCSTCAFLEAKKNKTKPSIVQPILAVPPSTKVGVPPPSISNAPPEDIEMMDVHEVNRAREAYHKELDSLLETKARNEAINTETAVESTAHVADGPYTAPGTPGLPEADSHVDYAKLAGFETLPIDDSHASKVMRAASAYAEAAKMYALDLSEFVSAKERLNTIQCRMNTSAEIRNLKEEELKAL